MNWIWSQSTAQFRDAETNSIRGFAYSGFGDGLLNPKLEGVYAVGPLMAGGYTFHLDQTIKGKGPIVFRLVPDAETRTKILAAGREPDTFLMHWKVSGESSMSSSHGCLIPLTEYLFSTVKTGDKLRVVAA